VLEESRNRVARSQVADYNGKESLWLWQDGKGVTLESSYALSSHMLINITHCDDIL
jgi:hypothetical protein